LAIPLFDLSHPAIPSQLIPAAAGERGNEIGFTGGDGGYLWLSPRNLEFNIYVKRHATGAARFAPVSRTASPAR